MPDQPIDDDKCTVTIDIPCVLAVRAENFAKENGISITNVVIEALDTFLRNRK